MTDNRTTEMREGLTERGVKWWPMRNNGYYEDRDTEFVVNGKKHTAHEWGDGLAVYNLTTDQAIAAALGNGTLTAEQVRDAVLENFEEMHETRYDHWEPSKFDWQAITDELNAELGSGTCECVKGKCSNCGKDLPEDPYSDYEGNFCPSCGARIRKAVE